MQTEEYKPQESEKAQVSNQKKKIDSKRVLVQYSNFCQVWFELMLGHKKLQTTVLVQPKVYF